MQRRIHWVVPFPSRRIHRVVPFPSRRDVSFAFASCWWGHYTFSLSAFPTAPPAVRRALAPLDVLAPFGSLLRLAGLRGVRKQVRRPVSLLLRRRLVRAIRLVVIRCVPWIVRRLVRRRIVPVPLSPPDLLNRRCRFDIVSVSLWLPVALSAAVCVRVEFRC
jgi:hypothetical protein